MVGIAEPDWRGNAELVIQGMARKIVERFHPETLILFGSHAQGNATVDSDADLLVVMDVPDTRRAAVSAIRRALYPRDIAIDVVVVTPEQFARDRNA